MWAKITAGLSVALLTAWYYIKLLSSKNARLEHKDKINDKLKEIRKDQKEFKEEVIEDEKERIKAKVNIPTDDFDNFIDGM